MNGLFCPCEPHHPSPSSHPRLLPLLADATTSPGPAGREAALRPAAPAPSSLWVDTLLKWITFAPAKNVIPGYRVHLQQLAAPYLIQSELKLSYSSHCIDFGWVNQTNLHSLWNTKSTWQERIMSISGARVDITLDFQEKQTLYSTKPNHFHG